VNHMNGSFKTGVIHLAPILTSLLFGVLCTHILQTTQTEIYNITPFQEGPGSFANAAYFVILVSIGATVLYLLLKRKSIRLVVLITGFALTTAVFMLSVIYLSALLQTLNISQADTLIVLVPSFVITASVDFAVFRTRNRICDFAVLLLGGALGAFLGYSIPVLSAALILGFLAIYDIFAVCRGPVGKIAHTGLEQLRGLSFSFKDLQMGLGDITFYSMLIGKVLVDAGPIFCAASIVGILVGVFLAFKMLEKKGMFPGLPFPIAFGLIPLIISFFL
jgi:presenilin-like A22 family membrane protease